MRGGSFLLLALAFSTSASALQEQACTQPNASQLPFCNVSLPIESRLDDLIARIGGLNATYSDFESTGASAPSLGIPPINWWTEGLHGLGEYGSIVWRPPTPYATMFPMPSLTASSFNATLFFAIGGAISTEGRAFYNQDHSGISFFSPNVNLFRDPRWGRGQEIPGEDPLLAGTYAREFVRGLQNVSTSSPYLKSAACVKHFAGYDMEGWNGTSRFQFDANISQSDLVDFYLQPFQAGIQDGNASCIMCSYTSINGIPSCANKRLLSDIARKAYGFNGYIVADCKAVYMIWAGDGHAYTHSADETLNLTTASGLDTECGASYAMLAPHMAGAVKDGAVDYEHNVLGSMLRNLLRVRIRLGQFDPPTGQPFSGISPSDVCTPASNALSLEAALQGTVLLKNAGGALPLAPSRVAKIAVVGPNAANTVSPRGNYAGVPCFDTKGNPRLSIVSVLEGIALRLGSGAEVLYSEGTGIADNATAGFANATAAAAAADATVVVVGLDGSQEGEWNDRVSLALPGAQEALVSAVCAASRGPCVLVVVTGGPVDVASAAASPHVAAILLAGYGGPWGGNATAALLFGDASPSGKLAMTVYAKELVGNVSMFDMQLAAGPSQWPPFTTPGRTHMYYTGVPVFPFGWGLSYSAFAYSLLSSPPALGSRGRLEAVQRYLAQAVAAANPEGGLHAPLVGFPVVQFEVLVMNVGPRDAAEVVLGFLEPPGAGERGVPFQVLFAFERVFVPAGQQRSVVLSVEARYLTRVVEQGEGGGVGRVAVAGNYSVRFGVPAHGEGVKPTSGHLSHFLTIG